MITETQMLKGKVAVVTGSTSGIGLGVAEAFAAQGSSIVLNGFGDRMQIEDTRQKLEQTHDVASSITARTCPGPPPSAR